MNDLRTAAQQALEALEAFLSDELRPYEAAKASAALRAALAEQRLTEVQQEMERSIESLKAALAQEQAGPVATITECEACFTPDVCQLRGTCDHYAASQLRVATQPKRTAEPVQEPVAWSSPNALDWESHQSEKMLKVTRSRQDEYGFTQRLYTAPPKLVPLTKEEIDAMWREATSEEGFTTAQFVRNFVRSVERALEEKNRGR